MSKLTRVFVQVQSLYVKSQSYPEKSRYVFTYMIMIRNMSKSSVQILKRYWLITDGNGREIEIHGEGVSGTKPYIASGGELHYTSGIVLETPIGTMQGYYVMVNEIGDEFNVEVPVFRVAIKTHIH
ncbi:Co2+/Mg2+ efflux protein ApaG [Candidatus Pantoea edessiphila]|uniref:Co2+/Mg2+ efflux protein ApaG n=1 Tax=Candidatus Pantoea edessiphila TaxID=2044610 RepID=A0A2P5T072_9GAMM|nr:Co2+/Mg2+ efflux protein ApaG [Candidatus Pantoea edessiphila]PPI87963.1 Co2+/Mg2+ efflux protein ApaG [Candidatus Pantoea edessiphila]